MLTLIIVFMVIHESLFIVEEGRRGIVMRFGKVMRDNDNKTLIYDPGLHIKVPLIDTVNNLDARIQTMKNQADRFVTMEKKDLIVDSYIKWRISDFSRYYLATGGGDVSQAEVLLKRKFSDRLRSELGRLDVKGIVTDSRNRLMTDLRYALNNGTIGTVSYNVEQSVVGDNDDKITSTDDNNRVRMDINTQQILVNPNSMASLGIQVVDVRIKQINLPTEVSDAIYQRMRAEREAVARRHRSQGEEEAEKLRASADYEVTRTLSEAYRQALITRGEADAETVKLYADAFSRDPSFYSFVRSLRAYENIFNKNNNNIMVLSRDNNFFRFMESHKARN